MAVTLNPGSVAEAGTQLLEAAKSVDTRPVKAELAAFAGMHRKWLAAQGKVVAASAKESQARLTHGELDTVQDDAVDELARLLVGDGFSRLSPFKSFGAPPPKALKESADDQEAKAAIALAAAVQKDRRTGPLTRKAAQALSEAAEAVLAAGTRITPAAALATAQRTQRDALLHQWRKAHSVLRLAARLADATGGTGLERALFPSAPRAVKAKAKAKTPLVASPAVG